MQVKFFGALFLVGLGLGMPKAQAQDRIIVRVAGGLPVLQTACGLLGCNVAGGLDGDLGSLFLVVSPSGADSTSFLNTLLNQVGVVDAEPDLVATTLGDEASGAPPALYDSTPTNYYGTSVPHGYVGQPATQIIRLFDAQNTYDVDGAGTVAIIDTGVDPSHPAFAGVLLSGYDFTRNTSSPDETLDIQLPSTPQPSNSAAQTNGQTSAMVDQSTAWVIDGNPQYSAFGHGTMVAGLVHLAAPTAKILPLKAFHADGSAYTSDIIRAIYYAVNSHADVINMSFHTPGYSQELRYAVDYAYALGSVPVAAAGNEGTATPLYPAALSHVICVASVNNSGVRSAFSNYGNSYVWVAAPGEGLVTTYPFSTYAAGSGTSFSTPLVSGTIALLHSLHPIYGKDPSAQSVAHAAAAAPELGNGVLDSLSTLGSSNLF